MKDNQIPSPNKDPYKLNQHGDERIDNYYWLRDDTRTDEKVLNYLKDENSYTDNWFASNFDHKTPIVEELLRQVPDVETSFPRKNNDYYYYQKINKEEQLPRYYRKDNDGNEIMFLDANLKLKSQDYYSIGSLSPSNDNGLIGYTEDNNGRREYTIKILNPVSMKELNDVIERTTGKFIWSYDDDHIIYLKKDPITLIADSVYLHKIGSPSSSDILLYKESDNEFNLSLSLSRTKKYIYINIESTNSNEIRPVSYTHLTLPTKA